MYKELVHRHKYSSSWCLHADRVTAWERPWLCIQRKKKPKRIGFSFRVKTISKDFHPP